jgi:two-component system OmpR family response regulator
VIADDDADIRQLVVIAARRAGVEVAAEVDNGRSAWEVVSRGGIDLAILDISMPGMDGLEVAQLIRDDPSLTATQVLMVSASVQMLTGHGELDSAVGIIANRFILKPFSPRDLANTIADMMMEDPV